MVTSPHNERSFHATSGHVWYKGKKGTWFVCIHQSTVRESQGEVTRQPTGNRSTLSGFSSEKRRAQIWNKGSIEKSGFQFLTRPKGVFEISEGKDFLWLSFSSVCSLDHTKNGFLGYRQNQIKNDFGLNFNLGKIRKRLKSWEHFDWAKSWSKDKWEMFHFRK